MRTSLQRYFGGQEKGKRLDKATGSARLTEFNQSVLNHYIILHSLCHTSSESISCCISSKTHFQ